MKRLHNKVLLMKNINMKLCQPFQYPRINLGIATNDFFGALCIKQFVGQCVDLISNKVQITFYFLSFLLYCRLILFQ